MSDIVSSAPYYWNLRSIIMLYTRKLNADNNNFTFELKVLEKKND